MAPPRGTAGGAGSNAPSALTWPARAQYLGAMWCSTFALHNVSYVTQVLAKSGKAIPIMLAGLLRGKRQKRGQWVSVLFVVAGVVSFTLLNEMKVSKESTMAGMVLISASLCLDGVTGTLEDRLVERAPEGGKPGPLDFMFNINLWAVPFCAVIMLVNQEFGSLFQLLQSGQSGLQVIAWATSGAVGQCFIFYVIATDGAVVCSIATTLRKFTTVLLSIVVFGHTIGFGQMLAITVVFFGVGGLLHQKRNPDITPRQAIMFLSSLGAALLVMHLPTSALGTSANTGLRKGAF